MLSEKIALAKNLTSIQLEQTGLIERRSNNLGRSISYLHD